MIQDAYPELPELPFARTSVSMDVVVAYIKALNASIEVKCATYTIFRNESGNGKSGVNNNYIGLQADGGRVLDKWLPSFAGTCVQPENLTGKLRRFVCFKQWNTSIDFLSDAIQARGMYVGGTTHKYSHIQIAAVGDWPSSYWKEWVEGDETAVIADNDRNDLISIYENGMALLAKP